MRKEVRESKWRVSLTTQQGPIEKVVDAPTQDIAVSRAMRAFPGQQFQNVSVSSIDAQSNIPTAQASQQNQLPAQLQPLQPIKQLAAPAQILQAKQQQMAQVARESIDPAAFRYPYSITLPGAFRKVLALTSPVQINECSGQFHIILESQEQMKDFLGNLQIHTDRKAVHVILSGIRSSVS